MAWALAAFMRSWKWQLPGLKLERLGPLFPADLRQRLDDCEDPMEVHRLIEEVYQAGLREGWIPEETQTSDWLIH